MITLIVDIEKADDLAAVKNLFEERGLNYEVGEGSYEDFIYTAEIKKELIEDEDDYQRGELKLVTPEESRAEISRILAGKG